EESERDEAFVRQLAVIYGREVLVRRFDVEKVSVQASARQLRYDWFQSIVAEWGGGILLTAHHLDDNIETLLMNFFKGTGIAGLRGILPRHGVIARPLLFAGKAALHQFALEAGLAWVEDSSNRSDKYTRNYFRHQVIPLVEEVYPGALQNLADNLGRFREIETVYRQAIDQELKKLLEHRGGEVFVPVLKLRRSKFLSTVVFEWLKEYGFSAQQTGAVVGLLDSGSGKYVCSPTHRVLRNRNWLILSPLQEGAAANILVEEGDESVEFERGELLLRRVKGPVKDVSVGNMVALVDAKDIKYPLLLRKWRTGDYFYPLGMRKKKKLSRFFIDNKLSLLDKEKVWVLEMNKKIVWVVGMRIDDRFRVEAGTREVLRMEWVNAGASSR
ncbi:MAG: tRNA lysidine(34) synthetase TilS, partial [Bacteroidetes bacterium]|nr:tRNA lysidine(34) synthetase TilS [Bacteroidota bacterium]